MARWRSALGALGLVCAVAACDEAKSEPEPGGPDASPAGPLPGQPGPDAAGPGPVRNPPLGSSDAGRDGAVGVGMPPPNAPFTIRARLASAPGDKRQKGPDGGIEHRVTHVMAVNPAAANPIRYVSALADDGTFSLGVDLNTPWVIVLVDGNQTGSDMIAGIFRGRDFDLDSLAATRTGMVDLGDVNVDSAGVASAAVSTMNLLTALGLSEAAATLLGAMDDISLRYVNPDVDANGKIDALEDHRFGLDFHLRYSMIADGRQVTLADLLNRYADPSTTAATYGLGSAIATWAQGFFPPASAADFRIRFPTASGSLWAAPMGGTFLADQWIEEDAYFYTSAGSNSLGVSFDSTQPFPTGSYIYEVKGTALTFTNVRTHTLEELNRGAELIIPFLKVNAPDATCVGWSCKVSGLDYRWMKRASSGWTPATAEEIALVVPQRGGFLGFAPGSDMTKRLEFTIPGLPVEGTLSFAAPSNIQGGVTPDEIANLTVGDLCHVGVSYDDTLGMRIFQNWTHGPNCTF
jgi:hypothetical protein